MAESRFSHASFCRRRPGRSQPVRLRQVGSRIFDAHIREGDFKLDHLPTGPFERQVGPYVIALDVCVARKVVPLPGAKAGKPLAASGDEIDLDSAVPFRERAESPHGPLNLVRLGKDADFAIAARSSAQRVGHVNQQVGLVVSRKGVLMNSHTAGGRQLGGDSLVRQVDGVIAGECDFVLVGKRNVQAVPA